MWKEEWRGWGGTRFKVSGFSIVFGLLAFFRHQDLELQTIENFLFFCIFAAPLAECYETHYPIQYLVFRTAFVDTLFRGAEARP